jgi:hypothetical protein
MTYFQRTSAAEVYFCGSQAASRFAAVNELAFPAAGVFENPVQKL